MGPLGQVGQNPVENANPMQNAGQMGQFEHPMQNMQPMQNASPNSFGQMGQPMQPMNNQMGQFGQMGQTGQPMQTQSTPNSFGSNSFDATQQNANPTSFGEQPEQSEKPKKEKVKKEKPPKAPKPPREKIEGSGISFNLLIGMLWKPFVKPKEFFEEIMEEGNFITGAIAILVPSVITGLLSNLLLKSIFGGWLGSGFSLTYMLTMLIFTAVSGAVCTFAYYITAKNIAKVEDLTIDKAVTVAGAFSFMQFATTILKTLLGFVNGLLSTLVTLASFVFVVIFGLACHKSESTGTSVGSLIVQGVIQGAFVGISVFILFSTILSGLRMLF